MSDYKNKHLECVLKSHNIENDTSLMKEYRKKRDEVREDLKSKFGSDIYFIIHSGSYKKLTAVNIKFDMDLVVPFKKEGADTLKNTYESLYKYYNEDYRKKDPTLLEVKDQKVAIGLTFHVNGKLLDLDVVPGREVNEYEKDGDLNLFVNEKMGIIGKSSYLKTNIEKQIQNIKGNSESRDVIKLLKIWKRRNNQQAKSFALELISIRALEAYSGKNDPWSKLKHTIEFIRDNIQTIRLVDPGNSNNVVSDALETFQKEGISNSMKWMLEELGRNEKTIEQYFPVNPEFPCEENKARTYVVSDNKRPERLNDEDFG
ncbi:MAG: nucleotidyltransferase [Chitinophagaceae bacterium]|nr:MAG: nucleotidyltransferase [Chitinophagaceae bacterium]